MRPTVGRGPTTVTLAVVAGAAALAGCVRPTDYTIGPPPPTQVVSTIPTAADSAGVTLNPVPPGRTTTTAVEVSPGPASLGGRVTDNKGAPVPGATVRLERLVGSKSAHIDVTTGPDGGWSVGPPVPGRPALPGPAGAGLVGGQYQVRAWRAPELVGTEPKPVTVLAGKPNTVDLAVTQLGGVLVAGDLAPDEPAVTVPASLAVQYTVREVNGDGQLNERPVPGTPVLGVTGAWVATGGLPASTDAQGRVTLRVQCMAVGRQPLTVTLAGLQPAEVAAPNCKPAPAPSTSTTRLPTPTVAAPTARPPAPAPSTATPPNAGGNAPGDPNGPVPNPARP